MAEAAAAVLVVLVLAVGTAALRAVLDGARAGRPASLAVLAPVSEAARLLRIRTGTGAAYPDQVVAASLLLLAPLVRVALLGFGPGLPGGAAWLIAADAVWWLGAGLLGRRRAALVELPLLAVLAVPLVATGGGDVGGAALPLAAEAPVALLLLLAVGGVLLPWAVREPVERLGGVARLLAEAGRTAQPASAAVAASALLLGTAGAWTWLAAAVLVVVLVLAERRFPVPPERRLIRLAVAVLLPLAVVQLGVVVALTLLA